MTFDNIPESLQESLRRLERAWRKSNCDDPKGPEPIYAVDWGNDRIIVGEILPLDALPDHINGLTPVNNPPQTPFMSRVKEGLRAFFYEEVRTQPLHTDPVYLDRGAIAFPPGYTLRNAPHMKQV